MSIRLKILLYFLVPGILIAIIAIGVDVLYLRTNLKSEIFNRLLAASESRAEHIETYIAFKKAIANDLTLDSKVLDCLVNISSGNGAGCEAGELSEYLTKTKLISYEGLSEIYITNSDGSIVAASVNRHVGESRVNDPSFINGRIKPYFGDFYYSDTFDHVLYNISAPVKDKGELIGVAVASFQPSELYEIIQDPTGLGSTGEIYLVGQGGLMLSPSRFIENAVLNQKINGDNFKDCLSDNQNYGGENIILDHAKAFQVFKNYRGIEVVGTHAYVPEKNWCVLAEMEESEALAPVETVISFVAGIGAAAIVVVLFVAYWLGNVISRPIINLKRDVDLVAKGNYFHKAGTKSKDEIGQLSRAIDIMTAKLRKMGKSLDKKFLETDSKKDNKQDQGWDD